MKRVIPINVNPVGRLDILVSRLAEETFRLMVEPRSPKLWDALRPYVQEAAAKQVRRLGFPKRALTPAELRLLEDVLTPRRLKCTG